MTDPWPPRGPGEPVDGPAADGPAADVPATDVPAADVPGADAAGNGPDGPSPNRRALAIAAAVVLALMVVAALVGGGATRPGSPTFPPVGTTTGPAGVAAAATRAEVVRALAAQGLQSEDASRPYRPAEAPALATAPRVVLRAILPDDPDRGLIVIYELTNPMAATAAAEEQADYLASGVGRVQFPPDSKFVLRVVGSTVIFFAWSQANAPDPRTATIATTLESLGLGVPVPN